ncbi:hypothetical protein QBC39DRAFT_257835 [Podospora conica]|nr:hypothetical protein QBC39DRAFT_257835 [Schizothecium conicum]
MKITAFLLLAASASAGKFNQYANMDDCGSDANIISHDNPISGRCYEFDDSARVFFWDPAGMWNPRVYFNHECEGIEDPLSRNGRCMDRGVYNSFRMW